MFDGAFVQELGGLKASYGYLYRSLKSKSLPLGSVRWPYRTGYFSTSVPVPHLLGVSLRMENCFKANSTMRALREATHTTNIDVPPSQPDAFSSSLVDIPESSGSTATSTFQPIFNWGKSQPTFLSRFNQPTTPG